jgi:tetratricopeptide (TPR) repeat protein
MYISCDNYHFIGRAVRLFLVLIALAIMLPACTAHKGTIPQPETHAISALDEAALLSLAHRSYKFKGPTEDVKLSLEASERVLQKQPQNELANFYAARAISWLIEFGGGDVKALADRGYKYAKAAEKLDAARPEYAFLAGAFLGYLTRESPVTHAGSIKEIYDEMDRAAKADPRYEEGAPLRALGMLLVKSPAWPMGVGDADTGINYLKKAAQTFPDYPANHFYLAEAYLDTGRTKEAITAMAQARETLSVGKWGVPGQVWSKQLERLRAKAAEKASAKGD